MIHLRITPDSRLINDGVEQFTQTLCLAKSPLSRWNGRGFNRHPFVSFETVLTKENVHFVVTVLPEMESVTRKAIETSWPRVSIEVISDPIVKSPTLISSLSLRYHYMFAIRVDKRENKMLQSILETLNAMELDDEVYIQTLAEPAPPDWYQSAIEAYQRFKKGDMPRKLHFDREGIAEMGVRAIAYPLFGTINVITELLTGTVEEPLKFTDGERAVILRDRPMRYESTQKVRADAYDVTVRVCVACADPTRTEALNRMVTMAFRELDGDNQFAAKKEPLKLWHNVVARKMGIRLQKDYLSIAELARLHMLPSGALQEKYRINSIKKLETDIQPEILDGGMYFADYEFKGKTQPVFLPTRNKGENWNYLCKPHTIIGPMGCGKTLGAGANKMYEAVMNGFSALAIDPAKGQIGDELEKVLPPEKINRIVIGRDIISLDFNEVKYSEHPRTHLSKILVSFFNSVSDEAGAQTSRFLKAAIAAMQTGKLSELIRIFEDEDYRRELTEQMRDGMHKVTLERFSAESPNRQNQILSPIYNRLDVILGDEYLEECMNSVNELDMVQMLSTPGVANVLDVPKKLLTPEGIDLIVNILTYKLDLAMTLREEKDQFPFFVVYDEPHQFLKSADLWEDLAVESRKWRVQFTWMFHDWVQIPKKLRQIIKSAGPNYTIYSGADKATFDDLSARIAPFTYETDGVKIEQFHAINIIQASKEAPIPFIAHMALPPSERRNAK